VPNSQAQFGFKHIGFAAADLAHHLGGRKSGHGWIARCPAHNDHNPSLSISEADDGTVLVHCFAGCEQQRVLHPLADRGLRVNGKTSQRSFVAPERQQKCERADDAARKSAALAIWNAAMPAGGTPVQTYLKSRGITLPIPASIRFHHKLPHHPSATKWPAMVALIVNVDGAPIGVHRTYLALDGKAKAPVVPAKMTLGPCRHGAVRLDAIKPNEWLIIAEGIETALSVMQDGMPAWAAISAGGMKNLKLPPEAKMVALCADNDANGVGQHAAQTAGKKFVREGREVRIATPHIADADWNDVLLKLNGAGDGK
jgi:phage/plasmid primase-like uncharacterized protein